VLLGSENEIEVPAAASVLTHESDCLLVATPTVRHPWVAYHYRPPIPEGKIKGEVWRKVMILTRRCLNSLHALSNERIGSDAELLKKYVVATDLGEQVLAALTELGVLQLAGAYYVLEREPLAQHGVNHASLTGDDPHDQLDNLVSAMFQTRALVGHVTKL
jgi:hypothetical protein